MSLEARIRDRFRARLARFVEKERQMAGCAKLAMKSAARKLGMSAVAIYRVVGGYGPVKVQAHHHAALIMHSIGIVSAAAKRMGRKRQPASTLHA